MTDAEVSVSCWRLALFMDMIPKRVRRKATAMNGWDQPFVSEFRGGGTYMVSSVPTAVGVSKNNQVDESVGTVSPAVTRTTFPNMILGTTSFRFS